MPGILSFKKREIAREADSMLSVKIPNGTPLLVPILSPGLESHVCNAISDFNCKKLMGFCLSSLNVNS